MHRWMLALFLALPVPLAQAGPAGPDNIVATFSIVARDPETGALDGGADPGSGGMALGVL